MSHEVSTLNKLKETKIKKENIKKKYGENQNVLFTDEEYEKVKAYFPNDYEKRIQALDDYIQSKGAKYKDFVATLKNWARREGYKEPVEKTEKKVELKEVDLSSLTPKEYRLANAEEDNDRGTYRERKSTCGMKK